MRKLLDARGDVLRIFHYDEITDAGTVETLQPDVDPTLDLNHQMATDGTKGDFDDRWGRRIASVPITIYDGWRAEMLKQGIFWDKKAKSAFLRRKLNSSEWRKLRTSPGTF